MMLPDFVIAADPEKVDLVAEMGTHAGNAKLDWPWRQKAVRLSANGCSQISRQDPRNYWGASDAGEASLEDDPADARGFLSSAAAFHHASYGYLTRVSATPPERRDRTNDPHRSDEGSIDLWGGDGALRVRPSSADSHQQGCPNDQELTLCLSMRL